MLLQMLLLLLHIFLSTPTHSHTRSLEPGLPAPTLVTVAVDAIEYTPPVTLHADAKCRGQVVFTGGSSLDIRIELLQVIGTVRAWRSAVMWRCLARPPCVFVQHCTFKQSM